MKNFEEAYRKRFQNQESTGNINSEQLWSQVTHQLDGQAVVNTASRSKRYIFGFIGLLFSSGLLLWMFNSDSTRNSSQYEPRSEAVNNQWVLSLNNFSNEFTSIEEISQELVFEKGETSKISKRQLDSVNKLAERQPVSSSNSSSDLNEELIAQNKNSGFASVSNVDSRKSRDYEQSTSNEKLNHIAIDQLNEKDLTTAIDQTNTNSTTELQGSVRIDSPNTDRNDRVNHLIEEPVPSDQSEIAQNKSGNEFYPAAEGSEYPLVGATDEVLQSEKTSKLMGVSTAQLDVRVQYLEPIEFMFQQQGTPELITDKQHTLNDSYVEDQSWLPSELSLSMGSVLLKNSFHSGDNASETMIRDELSATTHQDWGYSGSVKATLKNKSPITLSLGVDFDHWRSIYDKVTHSQTTVTEDDRIIDLTTNSEGEVVPVYGPLDFAARETHTILHHNSFKMITIPVEVGFEKNFNLWNVGLNLGLGYSQIVSQNGRSLNENGELVFFEKGDENLPFRKSGISYHAGSYIGYKFHEKFELRLEPSYRTLPKHDSPLHGVRISSHAYSIKIGLAYRLR